VTTLLTGPTVGASHRVPIIFCAPDIFFSMTIQSLKIFSFVSMSAYLSALNDVMWVSFFVSFKILIFSGSVKTAT